MTTKSRVAAGLLAIIVAFATYSGSAVASSGCPGPVGVAHRGESTLAPEETTPSIVSALKGGAQVIEFDVQWSRSGTAVLMHDPKVDRTTNGTGYVSSLWTYQLKALDAGSWFSSAYKGTRIPTLGEALRLIRPYAGVMATPELKGAMTDAKLAKVAQAIVDNGMSGRVILHSQQADTLRRFHEIAPSVPIGFATDALPADPVRALKGAGADYWFAKSSTLTAANVEAAHAAGVEVWAWTVDSASEWERLTSIGVDGILTNRASRYVGWITARCGVAP